MANQELAVATQGSESASELFQWKYARQQANFRIAELEEQCAALLKELEDTRCDLWCWLNGDQIRFEDAIDRIDALVRKIEGAAQ